MTRHKTKMHGLGALPVPTRDLGRDLSSHAAWSYIYYTPYDNESKREDLLVLPREYVSGTAHGLYVWHGHAYAHTSGTVTHTRTRYAYA